jgi:hypothetical protein
VSHRGRARQSSDSRPTAPTPETGQSVDGKPSNEMPFGVAVIFTLVGTGLFLGVLLGWIAPALWVRFAYRPATATVLETQPTERPTKGGRLFGLRARLGITAEGTAHEGWVTLPRETRSRDGPEAEAVRGQVAVGQRVPCFHDPFRPGGRLVLERARLSWRMPLSVLFSLLFLGVGLGGMAASWEQTFPRGLAAETAEVVRRLPRPFYLDLLGAAAIGVIGAAARSRSSGGLRVPILLGSIFGVAVLVLRAARSASVAWPSPERRAARGLAAGHPSGDKKPVRPSPATWAPPRPIAVDRGENLAARLRLSTYSGSPAVAAILGFLAVFIAFALAVVLLERVSVDLAGKPRSPARLSLVAIFLLASSATAVASWARASRRVRGLTLEISRHPLHPGRRLQVIVTHTDPTELARVRVELICQEEAAFGDQRGGKNSSRGTKTRAAVEFGDPPQESDTAGRRGHLDVPQGSVPSLALGHHWIDWSLVVRLGGPIPCTVHYPVTVEAPESGPPPGGAPPSRRTSSPAREHDGPGTLWLDSDGSFSPGATLSGGYTVVPADERPLESVEFSALWETHGPGQKDLGVCHYEDRAAVDGDDLPLYGTRPFQVPLPSGPPSYEGAVVKIRWLVRLRLRYADGGEVLRELPFSLGRAEA